MKKLLFLLGGLAIMGNVQKAHAQLKDVTFTVSPVAEYAWWNHNLNLTNTPLWGVRAGFGLGKLVELRASYQRSTNLKSNVLDSAWPFTGQFTGDLDKTKVQLQRWGGELKVNLWSGTVVSTYLTAGSGVMNFKYNDLKDLSGNSYKEDQLYGALGAGLKFNIKPRVVLSIEAKNVMFKPNEARPYLKPGVDSHKLLQNWSALASLDFYLGGYNDKNKNAITNAYREYFGSGFRGMKLAIEPSIAYWSFNNKSSFRNQVFEGVSAGIDFTSLFGIRGFYYQATKHNLQPDIKFNKDLKMYGGNLIARLNNSRGVNPYLTLGAGYLDVNSDKYVPKEGMDKAESGWFLMGGAGLEIPLSRYIALFGSVNAMLTRHENDIDDIVNPSSLNVGIMSQAGLRFNIGRSAKDGYALHKQMTADAVDAQREADMKKLNTMRANYNKRTAELDSMTQVYNERTAELKTLKADFNQRIAALNEQLKEAVAKRDTVEVTKIVVKKQKIDEARQKIDSIQDNMENEQINQLMKQTEVVAKAPKTVVKKDMVYQPKLIRLTQAEFTSLVNRVVEAINKSDNGTSNNNNSTSSLSELDRLLLINALSGRGNSNYAYPQQYAMPMQMQMPNNAAVAPQAATPSAQSAQLNKENLELMNKLNKMIDKLDNSINNQRNEAKWTASMARSNNASVQAAVAAAFNATKTAQPLVAEPAVAGVPVQTATAVAPNVSGEQEVRTRFLKLNTLSLYGGTNFGDAWNGNIGIRSNMQISNTNLDFMPEFYVGLGRKNGFGISANVVYNFDYKKLPVIPYAGLGLGVFRAGGNTRFGPNIIIGLSLRSKTTGSFFLDYSSRNLFKNNQIAVGYKFVF